MMTFSPSNRSVFSHNGVDTSHLLADHKNNGNDSAFAVSRHQSHFFHQSLSGGTTCNETLVLELCSYVLDLVLDVVGVGWETVYN